MAMVLEKDSNDAKEPELPVLTEEPRVPNTFNNDLEIQIPQLIQVDKDAYGCPPEGGALNDENTCEGEKQEDTERADNEHDAKRDREDDTDGAEQADGSSFDGLRTASDRAEQAGEKSANGPGPVAENCAKEDPSHSDSKTSENHLDGAEAGSTNGTVLDSSSLGASKIAKNLFDGASVDRSFFGSAALDRSFFDSMIADRNSFNGILADRNSTDSTKLLDGNLFDSRQVFKSDDEFGDACCNDPQSALLPKPIPEASYPENINQPSFLVQIPFYALKKEKNRKCSVCGKHGRTPSDLLRHMRVHTGERPFPCTSCDKKFKCKRSQLTHQYLMHGIKEGLSNHRLQVLELKRMKHRSPKNYSYDYDMPPVLESQVVSPKPDAESSAKQPVPPDQDEDTEILEGEDNSVPPGTKTDFSGLFSSPQKSEDSVPAGEPLTDASAIQDVAVGQRLTPSVQDNNEFGNADKIRAYDNAENDDNKAMDTEATDKSDDPGSEDKDAPELPAEQSEEPKVPVLHIKTHKCTHCTRQFRSIYTLRYHLRSMHDEKVYLSPALESRLKKRRWLPPHVRLQKSKMTSVGPLFKHKQPKDQSQPERTPLESGDGEPLQNSHTDIPLMNSTFQRNSVQEETAAANEYDKPGEQEHRLNEEDNNKNMLLHPGNALWPTIKTEKQDPVLDAVSSEQVAHNTDVNNNTSNANSALRNILTSKESFFSQLHQYTSSLASHIPVCANTNLFSTDSNKSTENPYVVHPHIFLPSNSQLEEGLENSKPVSWESLRVTSENVLVTKMEAVHPTTQQKYVLYKCSQCGKAFSGLRAISVHLASHNDNSGKECEKCGASFKWQSELDAHLECHRAERKYTMPSSQFLPSYYVNPFAIPVLSTNDQTVMPTTGLLSYPFFPMPQQIPPLVQPGFYPFFAAALQPPSQVPLGDVAAAAAPPPPPPPPPPVPQQQQQLQTPVSQPQQLNASHVTQSDSDKDGLDEKNMPQNCSFQCKVCPKTFDRIFSLQRHERIHSGVKACFCKTCGRGFSELRNLRHHILRFHADAAKMEPLPYRRHPTRVKSSSQRLVSFLKKTAVKILNSMGQHKLDPPASSVKIQTDDLGSDAKASEPSDVPEDLSTRDTFQNQPLKQHLGTNADGETLKEKADGESSPSDKTNGEQNSLLENGSMLATGKVNYLQVPEVKDFPTLNGSSLLNEVIKSTKSDSSSSNRHTEVLQDPKRSLLGNRRKGRPFKLTTTTTTATCNFLNPIGEDNLYAITQKILSGMPKLNMETPNAFLQPPPLGESVPNEFTLPQLNYFNQEPQLNEPLDMTRESKIPHEIKTEPDVNSEPVTVSTSALSAVTHSFASVTDAVSTLAAEANTLQPSEGKCMFPCSYCQRSFSSLSDLNRHMAFHADIRPFKCPYCSYCSRTNSQLKVHMMRHEGIKHYMCQICNYNGVTQSDLNRHLKTRTHLLRSRNICACCGTGFHTRSLSEEHYKSCSLLASTNSQDRNKNQQSSPNRLVIENRNRGNRLKHVPKRRDETMKSDFYQKLCEMRKMGIPFADFIQQSTTASPVK